MGRRKEGHGPIEEGLVLVAALLWDRLGEPPAALHPVVWYGRLIRLLEQSAPQRVSAQLIYGAAMPLLALPCALFPTLFYERLLARLEAEIQGHYRPLAGLSIALRGAGLKPFFAVTLLIHAGRDVRRALERGELAAARQALRSLVSRDRSQLSEELAAAAAIESLAENLCDSVVAPLFYYSLWSLPGAAVYRLINTFDSMIGYHGRYEYLGKAAARLDDLANLLPARLTALLIIATAPLFGGDWCAAWRLWRRDARRTESPNAGHPMSAAAGALGVQLEKVGQYVLGEQTHVCTPGDIQRAERMVWSVSGCMLLFAALVRMYRSCYHA